MKEFIVGREYRCLEGFSQYFNKDAIYKATSINDINGTTIFGGYFDSFELVDDKSDKGVMGFDPYKKTKMTESEFNKVVEDTLESVRFLLIEKGIEYRRNNDVFHNFHKGAEITGLSREQVLDGFLLKHEVSISDMTDDLVKGILPTKEKVDEKFLDDIVYKIIKKAMFIDRINQK